MRVGVFDSGVGGLTVLKKLIEKYPKNDYIYFGDTKNVPYGEKNKNELFDLSSKIVEFFIENNIDLIVIACGTISSNCYSELKNKYSIPIIDIISPTIKYVTMNNYDNIGVIATTRTIDSHIFRNLLKDITVYEEACSEFVNLIENDLYDEIDIDKHLSKIDSDTIILGCTHYPLIKDKIKRNCIDMADNIVLPDNNGNSLRVLYFSKLDDKVIKNVNKIINKDIITREKASL